MNLDKIVEAVKMGVAMAGGMPVVFPAEDRLLFCPFTRPASIGPPETKIVGILTLAAAIKSPGTFLSQFGTITSALSLPNMQECR